MSKLSLSTAASNWQLNVLSFSSPLFGMLTSAQTKTMAMHFPIKCAQPEIQFTCIFTSEKEYEDFQRFIRSHQQALQRYRKGSGLVWLNWPERDIDNWTGVIRTIKAGGMRRNFAPRCQFTVDLVDSMLSHRTDLASTAPNPDTIFGAGMVDGILGLPTQFEEMFSRSFYGSSLFPQGQTPANLPEAAPPGGAVNPGLGGGILPGGG